MDSCEELLFHGIPVEIVRRRVRYTRVEFRRSRVRMVLPPGANAGAQLEKMKPQVLKGHRRLQEALRASRDLVLSNRTEPELMALIQHVIRVYGKRLKVQVKDVRLRQMKRRWGSCRSDGRITINRRMRRLPDQLVTYVVVHELIHLIVPAHDKRFKTRLKACFPDMRVYENRLALYAHRCLPE